MFLYFLNISNWLQAHQLPCLFKSITHFDCPGCGIQRSFIFLLKGNILQSVRMYPALIPIILLFTFLLLHLIVKIKNGQLVLKYTYIFCVTLIMVSYIYKLFISNY